jgi:hypothetical protein
MFDSVVAHVADDLAMTHKLVAVARVTLSVKKFSLLIRIPENSKIIRKS